MTTKRIDKLSPEQVERFGEFRSDWLRRGLAVGPCDRSAMEAAADEAYRCAGLPVPKIKIWLGSPFSGAIGAHLLTKLPYQVRAQVGAQVWAQVRAQVSRAGYGQHDAAWLAFYDFFSQVCGLEICNKLRGLNLLSECGWWWPFAGAVILTERPIELHRDDQGRLHNTEAAAVLYPDDFALYAVHGVRVPAEVITHPISLAQVYDESNAEIKRVMIERYGLAKYIIESGCEVVSRDTAGILYRKPMENGDEPIVMVHVLNSTPEPDGVMTRAEAISAFGEAANAAVGAPEDSRFKSYFIRVPPTMKTAKEAVAWTFNMTPADYLPALET